MDAVKENMQLASVREEEDAGVMKAVNWLWANPEGNS